MTRQDFDTDRDAVRALFKQLRTYSINGKKVRARMAFSCCGSCASAELSDATEPGTPVVYYSRQGDDCFDRDGMFSSYVRESDDHEEVRVRKPLKLYLNFGINTKDGFKDVDDHNALALGELIASEARDRFGFTVEWDHSVAQCVAITYGEETIECEQYRGYKAGSCEPLVDRNGEQVTTYAENADQAARRMVSSLWFSQRDLEHKDVVAVKWDEPAPEPEPTWIDLAQGFTSKKQVEQAMLNILNG